MGSFKDLIDEATNGTVDKETGEILNEEQTETAVAVTVPKMQGQALTMWNDTGVFETSKQMAKILAGSDIVPQSYKGKGYDCLIAIDMANRMGVSPLVIMQNSQIVKGNFSWKGTACKAMIDGCGKYKDSRYVEVGKRGEDSWGYYLEATDKHDRIIKGCTVDIAMAKAEGWWSKKDRDGNEISKWQTMPELMLKYRAAAFFFRTECASLAMGFLTSEEIADISN